MATTNQLTMKVGSVMNELATYGVFPYIYRAAKGAISSLIVVIA